MKKKWILIGMVCCAFLGRAEVKLASMFSQEMVLQRDARVPVWGTASAGEEITVEFNGQTVSTVTQEDGTWRVDLEPMPAAAEPAELVVTGENEIHLSGVLIGDVWFCSGQSNMSFEMSWLKLPQSEMDAATNHPSIRLFKVGRKVNPEQPEKTLTGIWVAYTPETSAAFSAVANYFGRALSHDLQVPVGLIQSAWGGTPVEAWMRRGALENISFMAERVIAEDGYRANYSPEDAAVDLEKKLAVWQEKKDAGDDPGWKPSLWNPITSTHSPSTLYNGMVAPVIPYAIRGVIWYQGESNAGRHAEYREVFSSMILDWRAQWNQGDFPFLFVQLANFMKVQTVPAEPSSSSWPYLREAQTDTLSVPHTAMVVITDVGEADDIHPQDKKTVGERLALAARAKAYGENLISSGPVFQGIEIKGRDVWVSFDSVGDGLVAHGTVPTGFALSDEEGVWHWADAHLEGEQVVLSSEEVQTPVAVRYNWANNPIGNLYNQAGLPASSFRTDRDK